MYLARSDGTCLRANALLLSNALFGGEFEYGAKTNASVPIFLGDGIYSHHMDEAVCFLFTKRGR